MGDPILDAASLSDGGVQSKAADLTSHPTVQAAIAASYKTEAEIAAITAVVGMIDRALGMLGPAGAAAKYILTGTTPPPSESVAVKNAAASLKAQLPAGSDDCPITKFLEGAAADVGRLLGQKLRS